MSRQTARACSSKLVDKVLEHRKRESENRKNIQDKQLNATYNFFKIKLPSRKKNRNSTSERKAWDRSQRVKKCWRKRYRLDNGVKRPQNRSFSNSLSETIGKEIHSLETGSKNISATIPPPKTIKLGLNTSIINRIKSHSDHSTSLETPRHIQ